jgi:2-methylcitrate dehydratase PrpD
LSGAPGAFSTPPVLCTLGRALHRAAPAELSEAVIDAAKLRLLDYLGTALNAAEWPAVGALRRVYGEGPGEATVIGSAERRPCATAALLNSIPHLSEGSRHARGHCAWIAVPAALAAAELQTARAEAAGAGARPATGLDLLLALVLSFEVMLRLGEILHPGVHERGFQTTTVRGPLGAAAAAAKLLGLDEEATVHALALAAPLAGGLNAALEPWPVYQLQVGRATEAGVRAALAAEAGLRGDERVLEDAFLPAFGATGPPDFADLLVATPDRRWALEDTYLKIHFGCRHTHPPVDACLDLLRTHALTWEDLAALRVRVYPAAFEDCRREPARTAAEAVYDIHAAVAIAAVHGDAGPHRFRDEVLHSAPVQQVLGRITVEADAALGEDYPRLWPAAVEAVTGDGRTLALRRDLPRGEPEDPYPAKVIAAKFHRMARQLAEPERRRIQDFVLTLEQQERAADLGPLLAR